MKNIFLVVLSIMLTTALSAVAGIERVDEGGQELNVDDHVPYGEIGILVFYASWDTPSSTIMSEIESWSSRFVGLNFVFVDITDLRTPVCRQYGIKEIPSIIVLDKDRNRLGSPVNSVDDLEELLSDEGMI